MHRILHIKKHHTLRTLFYLFFKSSKAFSVSLIKEHSMEDIFINWQLLTVKQTSLFVSKTFSFQNYLNNYNKFIFLRRLCETKFSMWSYFIDQEGYFFYCMHKIYIIFFIAKKVHIHYVDLQIYSVSWFYYIVISFFKNYI